MRALVMVKMIGMMDGDNDDDDDDNDDDNLSV